jgi:pimeloyl-ACP methyl ester carboxylesterase
VQGSGAPVILLHGWPDSWFTYSRVLPLLPPDIQAFAPDQRGFGDSERPAHGYAIADFAADVLAFMDAMSLTRAAIVGHSFGSFVARAVALAAPGRVTRLILIGSGISKGNAVIDEVRAAMVHLRDPVSEDFAREFQASTAYVPLPEDFFDRAIGSWPKA